MVINLIFVLLLCVCAILLVSGKSLNIHITHTHKVEESKKPETPVTQEQDTTEDSKELSELLQNFWGVLNEE